MAVDLLYLGKANVVLTLFVAAYYGLLRQLTFFKLNRLYLLVAVLFAAVYPCLPVPALLPASAVVVAGEPTLAPLPVGPASTVASPLAGEWQSWLLTGYCLVAGILACRLLGQLLSLVLVRRRARPAVVLGQSVRLLTEIRGSFSFGQTIYLSESVLADPAALTAELRHEQAHVRQWHTLDVLFAQLAVALAWVNPAAWLWRRAVLENLEYLADQAALQAGLERQAYQYSLLRQQPAGVPAPALAFRFSAPTLKKRIQMLNQPASSNRQLPRYLLAAPLMMLVALGYAGVRARTKPVTELGKSLPAEALYYLDGQESKLSTIERLAPAAISSVEYVEGATVRRIRANPAFQKAVIVTTKAQAESPAVHALADRADLSASYIIRPLQVNAILPKSLAYITAHYQLARLSGQVQEYTKKSTGAVKLRVQLAIGRRPFYIYFSPTGEFLPEEGE